MLCIRVALVLQVAFLSCDLALGFAPSPGWRAPLDAGDESSTVGIASDFARSERAGAQRPSLMRRDVAAPATSASSQPSSGLSRNTPPQGSWTSQVSHLQPIQKPTAPWAAKPSVRVAPSAGNLAEAQRGSDAAQRWSIDPSPTPGVYYYNQHGTGSSSSNPVPSPAPAPPGAQYGSQAPPCVVTDYICGGIVDGDVSYCDQWANNTVCHNQKCMSPRNCVPTAAQANHDHWVLEVIGHYCTQAKRAFDAPFAGTDGGSADAAKCGALVKADHGCNPAFVMIRPTAPFNECYCATDSCTSTAEEASVAIYTQASHTLEGGSASGSGSGAAIGSSYGHHQCGQDCGGALCEYCDDAGCCTSDPSGAYCKAENPHATMVCDQATLCIAPFTSGGCTAAGGSCEHVFVPAANLCVQCLRDTNIPLTEQMVKTLSPPAEWCGYEGPSPSPAPYGGVPSPGAIAGECSVDIAGTYLHEGTHWTATQTGCSVVFSSNPDQGEYAGSIDGHIIHVSGAEGSYEGYVYDDTGNLNFPSGPGILAKQAPPSPLESAEPPHPEVHPTNQTEEDESEENTLTKDLKILQKAEDEAEPSADTTNDAAASSKDTLPADDDNVIDEAVGMNLDDDEKAKVGAALAVAFILGAVITGSTLYWCSLPKDYMNQGMPGHQDGEHHDQPVNVHVTVNHDTHAEDGHGDQHGQDGHGEAH